MKNIIVLNVTYQIKDIPSIYSAKVAVSPKPLSIDEFDDVMSDDEIIDVFEYGEKIIGVHGDIKILTSEVY